MATAFKAPLATGGASAGSARMGLVLLHGRGGSAADILGLGAALGLPDIALIAPEAAGRSWWPTSFLAPAAQIDAFVSRGLDAVDAAVDRLMAGGLRRDRIAIAGFSQGGCLALDYGARNPGLAAVFGLSAALVGTGDAGTASDDALYGFSEKRFDYATSLDGCPVTIAVHERDPHIPLARARKSVEVFAGLGAEVRFLLAPGAGHGITDEGVAAMRAILNQPA
jgi:predicted esterase